MTAYTFVSVKTRTEAVVDQVDMFLQYAGINESARDKILEGLENRWLKDVGVYLTRNGKRFLEAEIGVDWNLHSDLATLTPSVRTDLPGWENGASPEVRTIGRRFGKKAQELRMTPTFWVRFTPEIYKDPAEYRRCCLVVGVSPDTHPPPWGTVPAERRYEVQDLPEVHSTLRSS